jgi:hypothetical protein
MCTAVLMLPSLAHAEPPAEGPAAPSDEGDKQTDVLYPDLAADAPQSDWIREGYGTGKGVEQDPRLLNRKIRRAGTVTLAGGGIAVLGGALAISGVLLMYIGNPAKKLTKLAEGNGGVLPTDSDKRHSAISTAYATPIVIYTGLGLLAAGIITAAIARVRLKKLREQRRTSIVSVSPTMRGRGATVHWEVRF